MVGAALRGLASAVVALGGSIVLGGIARADTPAPSAWADAGSASVDAGSAPGDAGAPSADALAPAPTQPAPPPTPSSSSKSASAAPNAGPPHREINIVPIAGGDSDVGLGCGEVSDWASLAPGPPSKTPGSLPYLWRLESEAFITFKTQEGSVIIPFQDYSLTLTVPNFTRRKHLLLNVRGSFTNEATLKYYGIGNATPLPASSLDIRDTEYARIHPTLFVEARFNLAKSWFLVLGDQYTYNRLTVRPGSLLANDQTGGSAEVRSLIGAFNPHSVDLLEVGIEYDSRDNQIVTRHGMFHELKARVSPRVEGWLPYDYQQLDAAFRFYFTPVPRWLTITWRVVGDALLGSPPFYELARFDETPAIGGVNAVRGVPAQRYYGKVKLFENFELQSEIWPFHIKKKQLILGVAAFLDAGRVWTDIAHSNPDLDGSGLGIKYGVGGGLRVQEGQTFVIRLDLAWSPDATPIGAYFAAGEIF
jgi:hypothetical protein